MDETLEHRPTAVTVLIRSSLACANCRSINSARFSILYFSTLACYLPTVVADLEIPAVFPDGRAAKITRFSEGSVYLLALLVA